MEPIPDRLIVLTFDDGKKSNATFAAPLLSRHGFGATFFITEGLEFADKRRYLDWDEIRGLHDAGFEIGNHHGNHVDVTTQSREEFVRDLEQVERSCAAHGIDVPTTYAYPGGHHDLGAVEALAAKGYRFARRGIWPERPDHVDGAFGRAYEPGVDHPLLIPCAGVNGASWDLADLCAAASCAGPGQVAVLTFHGVPDHHPWCHTDPGLFSRFVSWLAANDYQVIALRDLARYVDPGRRPADPYAEIEARQCLEARDLTCEYAPDPLGLQCATPRLRWTLASAQRDQQQTAYQVLVASRPELLQPGAADRWDSGKVSAPSGTAAPYAGQPLSSGETCHWSVRCWNGAGRVGPWAAPARFELGLLREADWSGDWIGAAADVSSPLLRREFDLAGAVRRARLYAAGLGFAELFVNGTRLGDAVLDPAATDYDKRILYVTHDVSGLLREGANAVGAMLGNGWYSEPSAHRYGDSPRLLLQLEVELEDGSTVALASGAEWRAASGPITANGLWGGECYDARLEQEGWSEPGFDDSGWAPVERKSAPGGVLEAQELPPIRVVRTLPPQAVTNPRAGTWVFDFGQLFGGWARVRVRGARGHRLRITYSARLDRITGLVDERHHVKGSESDSYVLRGGGEESYAPRFTYHPVRYVQLDDYPGQPAVDAATGCVVHSAVDLTQTFTCSDPLLERIHHNVRWTFSNGLYGFPLDCLHREHWGWTDPATITSTLYARAYMPRFWKKWLADIRCAQDEAGVVPDIVPDYRPSGSSPKNPLRRKGDPAWGGNYPLLVWYLYQYYGDRELLAGHYDGMCRCVAAHTEIAEEHLVTHGHYGDHMLPGTAPGDEEFVSGETPPELLWSGYYYRGTAILAQAARVLGKQDEARSYALLAGQIRDAINRRWFDSAGGRYASGSQTANAFALALGIVPEGHADAVLAALVDAIDRRHEGRLHTGNTGTTCLIDVLPSHGHGELLHRIATQTEYPGWGYMVRQGATTIWESWSLESGVGAEDSMIMWGAIDELFWGVLLGIRGPDYYGRRLLTPGFAQVEVRPQVVGDLSAVAGALRTVHGRVAVEWRREPERFILAVSLPPGVRGSVSVPTLGHAAFRIEEHGSLVWRQDGTAAAPATWGVTGVAGAWAEGTAVVFEVGSGDYRFVLRSDSGQSGD